MEFAPDNETQNNSNSERQLFLENLKPDQYIDYGNQRSVFIKFDDEDGESFTKVWIYPAGQPNKPELVDVADIRPPAL